jgi:hypothetical protein
MYINQIIILNAAVGVVVGLLLLTMVVLNAQSSLTNAQPSTTIKKRTSGTGSLDILLEAFSNPIVKNEQTNFKVIFDQKGSNVIQNHIDYDLIITKDNKQLFQASGLAGQAGIPLHTSGGIVTIPYTFQATGVYLINVTIYGILFNQIYPEHALFPINVTATPEANCVVINCNNYDATTLL